MRGRLVQDSRDLRKAGKTLSISLILLIACFKQTYSTDAPITTTGTLVSVTSSAVIPVTAINFNNIGSFSYEIHYNPAVALATGVTISSLLGGGYNANLSTPGVIIVGWYTFPGVTITGTPLIMNISFSKVSNGTTQISWYDDGYSCAYYDGNSYLLNDVPQSNFYFDGSLTFCSQPLNADFSANDTAPPINTTVQFSDLTAGCPTGWTWSFNRTSVSFMGGTNANSQNPQVQFNETGFYSVTLIATLAGNSDTEVKTDYIRVGTNGLWTGSTSTDWNTASNWDDGLVPVSITDVEIAASATYWPQYPGNLSLGSACNSMILIGSSQVTVTGDLTIQAGSSLTISNNGMLKVGGNWTNAGYFDAGTGTVVFTGSSPATILNGGTPVVVNNFYNLTVSKEGTTLTIPAETTIHVNGNLVIDPL